jgi:hypothetical protein
MRPHDDPSDDLSPEQRLEHIAAILAAGLRRLRPRTPLSAPLPPTGGSEKSTEKLSELP